MLWGWRRGLCEQPVGSRIQGVGPLFDGRSDAAAVEARMSLYIRLTTISTRVILLVRSLHGLRRSVLHLPSWFLIPVRLQMQCCGWNSCLDWNGNMVIINSSQLLFPCSCQNISVTTGNVSDSGFCEAPTPDWPVYDTVNFSSCHTHVVLRPCMGCCIVLSVLLIPVCLGAHQGCAASVERWLLTNIGVVLGICLGVALIEVLAASSHRMSVHVAVSHSDEKSLYQQCADTVTKPPSAPLICSCSALWECEHGNKSMSCPHRRFPFKTDSHATG